MTLYPPYWCDVTFRSFRSPVRVSVHWRETLFNLCLRMNHAPTKGYEKDVGMKTTHRAIYPESAVDLDNSTHLVLLPFKVLDLQWLISVFTTKNITRWEHQDITWHLKDGNGVWFGCFFPFAYAVNRIQIVFEFVTCRFYFLIVFRTYRSVKPTIKANRDKVSSPLFSNTVRLPAQ